MHVRRVTMFSKYIKNTLPLAAYAQTFPTGSACQTMAACSKLTIARQHVSVCVCVCVSTFLFLYTGEDRVAVAGCDDRSLDRVQQLQSAVEDRSLFWTPLSH